MKKKQLLIPLSVAAVVAVVYYFFRSKSYTNTAQLQANPQSSGVDPNSPQAQNFLIGAPIMAPTPGFTLSPQTFAPANYAGSNFFFGPPAPPDKPGVNYLTFNFASIFGKIPAPPPTEIPGGCGCGGACDSCVSPCQSNNSRYTDGRGGCMATSRQQQIAQSPMGAAGGAVGL